MSLLIRNKKHTKLIPYRWELIILLWFAFFFNQADRQIFNVMLPSIRSDLNLTDAVAPYILGVLKPTLGLANGLALLSVVYIFSGICILTAVLFFYKKDQIN